MFQSTLDRLEAMNVTELFASVLDSLSSDL